MQVLVKAKATAALAVMMAMHAGAASAQSVSGSSFWSRIQHWFNTGGGGGHGRPVRQVPEIDASAGLLAMAAVLAAVALAWELRRRRHNRID